MAPTIYKQMFKISTGYVYPAREWGWDRARDHRERRTPSTSPTSGRRSRRIPAATWRQLVPGPADAAGQRAGQLQLLDRHVRRDAGGKSAEDAVKSAHDRAVQDIQGVRRQRRVASQTVGASSEAPWPLNNLLARAGPRRSRGRPSWFTAPSACSGAIGPSAWLFILPTALLLFGLIGYPFVRAAVPELLQRGRHRARAPSSACRTTPTCGPTTSSHARSS